MEEVNEPHGQEQTEKSEDAIINIGNEPVMQSAIEVLPILGNKNKVILKARGHAIPNAVAVANIITEKIVFSKLAIKILTVSSVLDFSRATLITLSNILTNCLPTIITINAVNSLSPKLPAISIA